MPREDRLLNIGEWRVELCVNERGELLVTARKEVDPPEKCVDVLVNTKLKVFSISPSERT